MEYRQLGRSGVKLSTIGLGSWLTYGNQVDRERSTACVKRAFELGINFFDTADIYHAGAGETELGIALAGITRSDYVLATKCYWPMSDNVNNRGLSRKHIFESWEKSVRRLKTDYIDLYQCHRYDEDTPLDETLRALEDLVRQGKVLYCGISEWQPQQIKAAVDYADKHDLDRIVSSQPQYNMIWRVIEKEIIPLCEEAGIGQVVWSPLAQGVLTGKYLPGEPLPPDSRGADERASGPIQGYLKEDTLKAVQGLRPIAEQAGMTMAQMAIAWVLRQPNVTSAITGATRPEQVDENVKASEKKLEKSTLDAIDEALAGLIRY
ncbi:MAG: aldo/keto reductase family protein [Candidatus Dormibacteria bacterium]